MPALLRAQRIGEKAARIGFDWPDEQPILAKIEEELGELREAMVEGDREAIRDELGDVLFALTSLARHLQIDAEQGLSGTLDRFTRRFEHVEEAIESQAIERASLEQLETLWQQAKALEREG
jgi:ATP diphosphatase